MLPGWPPQGSPRRRRRTLLGLTSWVRDIRVVAALVVAVMVVTAVAPSSRVSAAATPERPGVAPGPVRGGWLVSADGSVRGFGGATAYGSTTSRLNSAIVGMSATPDGHGYWLAASDGGIFAMGDAAFYGSLGNLRLNQPIVGMAATPDGHGYWLVASDGGIFAMGDTGFYGSEGGTDHPGSIAGMVATPDGGGYWMGGSDGALYGFGDAPTVGSTAGSVVDQPIVGMAGASRTLPTAVPAGTSAPPATTPPAVAPGAVSTATVAPTTTSTTAADPFVAVCGTQLCLHGQPWYLSGGTAYGHYGDPTSEAALLTQANLDTSELVNFDSRYRTISHIEDSTTWNQVEAYIGQMGESGHYAMLNFSEFFAAMETAGMNPFSPTAGGGTNFSYQEQYLQFVADQSANGVANGDNPTIAKVELWGEPVTPTGEDCISSPCQVPANPQAMLTWYSTLEAYWHSLSHILISSGGFSHLNDGNSGCAVGDGTYPCPAGVPWQQIITLPDNATADIEDNSTNDQRLIPGFAAYANSNGRPWYLSAWSACQQGSEQVGSDYYASDAHAALHVTDMLDLAAGQPITNDQPFGSTAAPAAGFSFWDLGDQAPPTCEIGPTSSPISFAALATGLR